ncbi:hypothetical protein Y032_0498g2527 [Ancylostoma ceylanicum]|uniref:Uncharacterized protein n=1 Tax=Ancylostoma ceylanicum TaxID=53326 RepID=A0A016WTW8_9BILA|nr:hypothetical protein Y032_0498g2527 [Ancylostoma ceylanicum]
MRITCRGFTSLFEIFSRYLPELLLEVISRFAERAIFPNDHLQKCHFLMEYWTFSSFFFQSYIDLSLEIQNVQKLNPFCKFILIPFHLGFAESFVEITVE